MTNFESFLDRSRAALDAAIRPDGYARLSGAAADLYGTAAAVGVLVTLGDSPSGAQADRLIHSVRAFERADGTFRDDTHGELHRAATALTTLSVLGDAVSAPAALAHLLHADAVDAFLGGLDWANPWPASHDAAGLLAIGMITEAAATRQRENWLETYFEWLDEHADPTTGLWLAGRMGQLHEDPGLFGNLGCSFHLHFLYERAERPWPAPEGVVDAGLSLYNDTDAVVGRDPDWGFRQLDWAYSVGRAARSGHRADEVKSALVDLAARAAAAFAVPEATEVDLHVLQARVGLVAELHRRLPGLIDCGRRSLTSVVDARPFI